MDVRLSLLPAYVVDQLRWLPIDSVARVTFGAWVVGVLAVVVHESGVVGVTTGRGGLHGLGDCSAGRSRLRRTRSPDVRRRG